MASALDVSTDITLSRFKQSLLAILHERDLAEERCRTLETRLCEQGEATKAADLVATELRGKLDDLGRAREEAESGLVHLEKASEDERTRHALAARLAGEKTTAQVQKLQEQGQQLFKLEEQLRSTTAQASKLLIEKSGAPAIYSNPMRVSPCVTLSCLQAPC